MPRIRIESEATAIGVGIVDELTETLDRNRGWMRPFRNSTDITRVGLAAVGAYGYTQNRMLNYSEPLLYAGSALATKSISRMIRTGIGLGSGGGAAARRSGGAPRALMAGATVDVPNVGMRRSTKVTRI